MRAHAKSLCASSNIFGVVVGVVVWICSRVLTARACTCRLEVCMLLHSAAVRRLRSYLRAGLLFQLSEPVFWRSRCAHAICRWHKTQAASSTQKCWRLACAEPFHDCRIYSPFAKQDCTRINVGVGHAIAEAPGKRAERRRWSRPHMLLHHGSTPRRHRRRLPVP